MQKNRLTRYLSSNPANLPIFVHECAIMKSAITDPIEDWTSEGFPQALLSAEPRDEKEAFLSNAITTIFGDLLTSLKNERNEIKSLKTEVDTLKHQVEHINTLFENEKNFDTMLAERIKKMETSTEDCPPLNPEDWIPLSEEIDELLDI